MKKPGRHSLLVIELEAMEMLLLEEVVELTQVLGDLALLAESTLLLEEERSTVVKRLRALLTTPLHSRGQTRGPCLRPLAAPWMLRCFQLWDSVALKGKLTRPCCWWFVLPYKMKSSESSE